MIGRILTISKETITFSQGEPLSCFGCMQQECKNRQQYFIAKNPLGLPLSIGQLVEVKTPKAALLNQTLQVLVPPVMGFLGGFMLTGLLFPLSGDPPRAAGGVLILFIAACITYWIRKRFPLAVISQVTRVCNSPAPVYGMTACHAPSTGYSNP